MLNITSCFQVFKSKIFNNISVTFYEFGNNNITYTLLKSIFNLTICMYKMSIGQEVINYLFVNTQYSFKAKYNITLI